MVWKEIPPLDKLDKLDKNILYQKDSTPLLFYGENLKTTDFFNANTLQNLLKNKKVENLPLIYLKTLPDFIYYQEEILNSNLSFLPSSPLPLGITLLGNQEQVFIHPQAVVHPSCSLDTRKGPIYIDSCAEVMPFAFIQGPAFIGENTLVDSGSIIQGGCFLGKGCKIRGELETSIFLDYTNKHHAGFVGHSYVGSFVNFGALSTTSDLKNNYGAISFLTQKEKIKTSYIKLGSFIGDHAKIGIGSLLNSGTSIGIGANLFGGKGVFPKWIPSFAWGSSYPFKSYRWEEFKTNIIKIMQRRKQKLSKEQWDILKNLYDSQAQEFYKEMPFFVENNKKRIF